LVVRAKDPGRLADAILRLAGDPELRSRYGAAGHRRVRERFDMERCIAAYDALYRTLLAGGAPADIAEIRVS
jgi:MMP alpha-(1->4)-mannosyltransferase